MAQAFRKLNNFNGVMQIISAMEAAAVHRLSKTFERVRLKNRNKYAELHDLMSSASGYKLYREALGASTPPCIPYLGMYLTDFMTLEEMHKNTLEPQHPQWINFTKRSQIATLMKTIMEQLSGEYALLPVECVREWLLGQLEQCSTTTEEDLFKMSLAAEPRED